MPTARQLRAIHTLRRRVFADDEAYRAFLLVSHPRKRWLDPSRPSTAELDVNEARRVLDALIKRQTPEPAPEPAPPPRPAARPWKGRYTGRGRRGRGKHLTQAQADEIARLEHDLGWQDSPARVQGFIRKQLGGSALKSVEMLTRREATLVITGLRKLSQQPHYAA